MCERREKENMVAYLLRYVAEQPKAILALIGLIAASFVYIDFRSYINENTQCQRESVKVLTELTIRIQELEARFDKFHPIQK